MLRFVRAFLPILAILILVAFATAADLPSENLIRNGNFQTDANGDGKPDHWKWERNLQVGREGDNAWLVIAGNGSQSVKIFLQPEWGALRVACRMRVTGVEQGAESWHDARIAMTFVDAAGKRVGEWPNVIKALGTGDWQTVERDYMIPAGAVALNLTPALFTDTGKVEYDDLEVRIMKPRPRREDAALPEGAPADPWDPATAWRSASPTRETICLNGLWRFRPLMADEDPDPPALPQTPAQGDAWGWFKVPGIWPSVHWTLGQEVQNAVLPDWLTGRLQPWPDVRRAWYHRSFLVPEAWRGRKIILDLGLVQTHAAVWIDNQKSGEVWFPGGGIDITTAVRPGATYDLRILLTAIPLGKESFAFMDADRIVKQKASLTLRGLVGDVFLRSEPAAEDLGDTQIRCSVERGEITFDTAIRALSPAQKRRIQVRVTHDGKEDRTFHSEQFTADALADGRTSFTLPWKDAQTWDIHTPDAIYLATVSLHDETGKMIDEALPIRFGFREFRIEGRDFILNGNPIHLRALLVKNAAAFADKAGIEGARATCRRLREYGFNFFIMSNYGTAPGELGYFEDLLQAADEEGILCSFSLPHVKDFAGAFDKPEAVQRYRAQAEFLIRRVQNHPSVILYAMNHNYTAYTGDQNPLKIDGKYEYRDPEGKSRYGPRLANRMRALRAEAIVNAIDPTRPVYHHHSGNLGTMHTVNIYLNWSPRQERSDWLEHWATEGVKPFFAVEWGLPHISSWSSYRGPEFIWRCKAFQSIWDSEYAAAYTNQRAYRMTPLKIKSLENEEKLWEKGEPFSWGGMIGRLREQEENYFEIQALMLEDNWPAHRTWGASALLPWDQGGLWRRKSETPVQKLEDRYRDLQRPGIRPDGLASDGQYINNWRGADFEPTRLGRAFLRWNMPVIAYIGGGPRAFTDKTHIFLAGEKVNKQLVIVNDARETAVCKYRWTATGIADAKGEGSLRITPGTKEFASLAFYIPTSTAPGTHTLEAIFTFSDKSEQRHAIQIHTIAAPPKIVLKRPVLLYDPKGLTTAEFKRLGIPFETLADGTRPDPAAILAIGREALDDKTPALDTLAQGMRVLVFEQNADTLVKLGFRINVHGLRTIYGRAAGHPVLNGLADTALNHWRGAATLTPPYLDLPEIEPANPTWDWCGFDNTRVWRCGNRNNVASVLIEKPVRGNWMPIADGGFDLQYAPLLELVEGRGRAIFCQLDVTARTEPEPAAEQTILNLLAYLDAAPAPAERRVFFAGNAEGANLLQNLAIPFDKIPAGLVPPADALLVVGPGASLPRGTAERIAQGLHVVALGLAAEEVRSLLGDNAPAVTVRQVVPTPIDRFQDPALRGLSNADTHWRTILTFAGFTETGPENNEALRILQLNQGRIAFCQVAPWMIDYAKKPYTRSSYRRCAFLASRLLHNLGASAPSGFPARAASLGQPRPVYTADLPAEWLGRVDREDKGRTENWFQPDFSDADWTKLKVPGMFDEQIPALAQYDGVFWYRVRFATPSHLAPGKMILDLGGIDDESWVWLNGRFLGEVTQKTNPDDYWRFPRTYEMKEGMLKPAGEENVLVVRVRDLRQSGGFSGQPNLEIERSWEPTYYVQKPEAGDDPYRYYRW